VQFHAHRLSGVPARGESIEAWARRERYAALAAMARLLGIDTVLLAHHRRDQAETVLLQALRGGGPGALAAMPRAAERAGVRWLRPWRDQPREAIEAYLRRHRLRFVDDTSNADRRFARARLRIDVWPALVGAFPDAEAVLAAAARQSAQAAACARALAAIDAAACVDDGGRRLAVQPWRRLEPARQANLLRYWLNGQLAGGVPESLVTRLLDELPAARSGARWPAGAASLGLHRGGLVVARRAGRRPNAGADLTLDLSRPGRHPVPAWGGAFEVAPGAGLPASLLECAQLRARSGGEQYQRAPGTPPRSLKKQFQGAALPAWERDAPLVYAGEVLVFVPGLGVDARAPRVAGPTGRVLRWVADH
jgi:tRNA(Ile)-lysidine synthase